MTIHIKPEIEAIKDKIITLLRLSRPNVFTPESVTVDCDFLSKVIKKLYGANDESEILAPGWHRTHNTIANFVEQGIDRFLEEMDKYPPSLKSQVKHSLDLFIKDSNGQGNLIVPKHHKAFNKFMLFKPDKKALNLVYLREEKL